MIIFKNGDLFEDNSQALVNTVNCVGVMGRGIALQFKKRYADNFKQYEALCKRDLVKPGRMFVFETNSLLNPHFIINFPTKRHWKGASRLEDIEEGLVDLARVIKERKIESIAIPPIGCGLGGLDWNIVKSKIVLALQHLEDVLINVYEPNGAPQAESMARSVSQPKMTVSRAVLVKLMGVYNDAGLSPQISLMEVHKLLYFVQEAKENLRLNFVKEKYGPYAKNLSHVLNALEGHMIYGYADGGNQPNKQLKLIPGTIEDAAKVLQTETETLQRIDKVSALVDGFETPFGMELLATVHWVAKENPSLEFVRNEVYAWNAHKRQFTPRQIELALNRLIAQNWL